MKNRVFASLFSLGALAFLSACATNSESRITSNQPGPVVGRAVGTAVGAVGSNVAGAVVGGVEGAAAATKSTFTNDRRVIRTWREETTADGRVIKVPVEIEVDQYGRPIHPAKSGS